MSELTFSTLPDVCLLLVFDKIALRDLLLNVNLVNRHWNTISAVARQHRKRLILSLTFNSDKPFGLIIDSAFTDPFEVCHCNNRYFGGEHDSLIVPDARQRMNPQFIEHLVERLPNIATLEVNLHSLDISTSEHLATLINGWREHLVTLKLFTNYYGDGNQSLLDGLAQLTNLHTTINSLPVLHHLTYQLDFPFNYQNHNQIAPFKFPISCPSLKELYFTSRDFLSRDFNSNTSVRLFGNAFRDYVQSKVTVGLRKISFFVKIFYSLNEHLATSDVLSSRTTNIAVDGTFANEASTIETNLMIFCRKFYNLTHISYEIKSHFPVGKVSKCLSILVNLKHISFSYLGSMEGHNQLKAAWLENNNSDPDRVISKIDEITPLVQIKSVCLCLRDVRWHQFVAEDLCFNFIFPNVELVYIDNTFYNCVHCGGQFDREERKITRKSAWLNCIGPFVAPIGKCDKLKRIEYEDETDFAICCSLERFKMDWAGFIDC